jgi:hypothetical protein
MSPLISAGVIVSLILFAILILVDLFRLQLLRRFLWQLAILVGAVAILSVTVGFTMASRRVAFGGGYSVELAIGVMFFGVILGMIARYIFHMGQSRFSWIDFARPMAVSPIVLLPLIGALEGGGIETLQLASLVILAFQNGFFWQQVLKDAKPTSRPE